MASYSKLVGISLVASALSLPLPACTTTDAVSGLNSVGGMVMGQKTTAGAANTSDSSSGTFAGSGSGTTGFVTAMVSNAGTIASELDQSVEAQKAQARQKLEEVRKKGDIVENSPMAKRLTTVARRLASKATGEQPFEFEVYVTREKAINAYTAGGGIIFVTQGLVDRVQNEAQIAAVLSHEIAHVLKAHTSQKRGTNVLARIGLTATEKYGPGGLTGQLTQTGASVAANTTLNVYSRSQEVEADSMGIVLLIESNYEPGEMVRVIEIFERENGTNPEMTNFFFGSHPSDAERIKTMRDILKEKAPTFASRKFIKDSREFQVLKPSRRVAAAQ